MRRAPEVSKKKMLEAGRAALQRGGLQGLRLRAIAKRAGVNVGLFPYHFGSKKRFIRRVLQDVYDEFFGRLSLESQGSGGPVDRLRRSLAIFGRFARDQRKVVTFLFSEAARGDKEVFSYLEHNAPRHALVIGRLIAEGQKAGRLKPLPIPVAVAFSLGAMGMPNIIITTIERAGSVLARRMVKGWSAEFLSDRAIDRRVDLVLAGLSR